MSLLDDLKKQANKASAKSDQDDSKTLQKHQVNWNTLVPKQQLIITYMRELAENLNAIELEDKVEYSLTKNIKFKGLKRGNFRVRKADEKSVRDFTLRYDIVGERNVEIAVTNDFNAENIRTLLRNEKTRFTEVITDKGKAQFTFLPKITVVFQYVADVENCQVVLRIFNFEKPEKQEIKYQPEAVTDELMEEMAKYILNKENKFRSLSGNDVDDAALELLRSKLRKDGKIPTGGKQATNVKQDDQTKKKSIFGKFLKK
jgi:hypothetical protein